MLNSSISKIFLNKYSHRAVHDRSPVRTARYDQMIYAAVDILNSVSHGFSLLFLGMNRMCNSTNCMTKTNGSTRHTFLQTTHASAVAAAFSSLFVGRAALAANPSAPPKPQNVVSPEAAVKQLMDGNARYVSGVTKRHDFAHEREVLGGGQNPYAAVLSCADSRIAPEYAFDSARGDLFVTRVAGNFVNDDVLGSLEYAVAVLNVPVIIVLGHDKCGAVDAAVKAATKGATYPGKIQSLISMIVPAVNQVKDKSDNILDASITQNVRNNMDNLRSSSDIIQKAEATGKLKIIGGVYHLATGKVGLV